jgi:hypothetical protein
LITSLDQETTLKNIHLAIVQLQIDMEQCKQTQTSPEPQNGVFIEMLLLLRSQTQPTTVSMIHKELERQGLTVWKG